jgi:hypothetical protein
MFARLRSLFRPTRYQVTVRQPLFLESLEGREVPATFVWRPTLATTDGLWSTTANWREVNGGAVAAIPPAAAPGESDTVKFDGAEGVGESTIADITKIKSIIMNDTLMKVYLANDISVETTSGGLLYFYSTVAGSRREVSISGGLTVTDTLSLRYANISLLSGSVSSIDTSKTGASFTLEQSEPVPEPGWSTPDWGVKRSRLGRVRPAAVDTC